jgi:hypothetical protein
MAFIIDTLNEAGEVYFFLGAFLIYIIYKGVVSWKKKER